MTCVYCDIKLSKRSKRFYSNHCQAEHNYASYILLWRNGLVNGARGKSTRAISRHVLRYLWEKYESACSVCGWHTAHPLTGKPPLEVDHINGDAENNSEENLRLLCPNCHSLTTSYRNLNKGRGRQWRRLKYLKIT